MRKAAPVSPDFLVMALRDQCQCSDQRTRALHNLNGAAISTAPRRQLIELA